MTVSGNGDKLSEAIINVNKSSVKRVKIARYCDKTYWVITVSKFNTLIELVSKGMTVIFRVLFVYS